MNKRDIKPGLYLDISNDDYHKGPGISKTTLDNFSTDPESVIWSKNCPQDKEKLTTLDFGDAMHAICLEPDRLKTDFIVKPSFNLRTNKGKEEEKAFLDENKHKKVLTKDQIKKLELMFGSIMAHPRSRKLIESEGIAEASYFWEDKETGLLCKCRPDKNIQSKNLLVDVKTTSDLKTFKYSVDDFKYYVQAPWYCDGVGHFEEQPTMEFLVIQTKAELGRYPVQVLRLPDEAINYGRSLYRENLNNYFNYLNSEKEPDTQTLEMSWQFTEKAIEKEGEVFL